MKKAISIIQNKIKHFDWALALVPLCLLAGLFVLWAFTGQWPNQHNTFNSYALQAESWLSGHLNLVGGEYHTNLELAVFNGLYYVSFPPFPSYVLLPFVALFTSAASPDHYLACLSYLIAGVYAVKLFREMRKGEKDGAIFFPVFLLMANNVVYTSMNGWVWFIAQNFAFTLSLASIYYAIRKKGALSLALLACAVGCRPMQALYFPLLLIILYRQLKEENPTLQIGTAIKKKWHQAVPTVIIALSYMILNYARFGSITEFGHNYLPEFTRTKEGQFHISYLAENVKRLFRLPRLNELNRLDFYYFDGVCLFLVSPILIAFIIALGIGIYRKTDRLLATLLPLIFLVHIFILLMHRTLGGSHFGNRYFNDLLPFVYYGLLTFMPKKEATERKEWFTKLCCPLCIFGMLLNFVGTIVCLNQWY